MTIEKTALAGLLGIFTTAALLLGVYSYMKGLSPSAVLSTQVNLLVDYLNQSLGPERLSELGVTDPEEWKRAVILDFPSMVAISALAMVWANLVLLLRANPWQIRERLGLGPDFMRRWRAPEYLVWPTIAAGALLIVDLGAASDVALNLFKFFMAVYAIQGLSVLSFFFEAWRLKPVLRTLGLLAAVFLMMPLLLSLGFFDLWFDFREKFRQS